MSRASSLDDALGRAVHECSVGSMFVACLTFAIFGAADGGLDVAAAPWSPSLDSFVAAAGAARVVVVGERHGTVEHEALLRELIPRLTSEAGYTHVALEGPEDRQVVVDQFLAGVVEEEALEATFLSPGLRGAIALAKKAGVRVLLIDGPAAWNVDTLERTRDQRMFEHLRRVLDEQPGARVLVWVGNSHTVEGLQLDVLVEGAGHRLDAHKLPAFRLAHLLDVYLDGKSLSVRIIDPKDKVGAALSFNGRTRLSSPVDGTSLESIMGGVDPGGSLNRAILSVPLGVVTDWLIAVPTRTSLPRRK